MVVLGLNGGGTKTEVALVDRRGLVRRFIAGPGLDATAAADWEALLAGMVSGLVGTTEAGDFASPAPPAEYFRQYEAKFDLNLIEAAVLGLPYFSEVPDISARQRAVAWQVLGPGAVVRNDVDVAFEGALGGQHGVLILAGTGAMAWARGPAGTARAGGFGEVFGDEGSAYWIGRAALGLVSRHLDGRRRSAGFARGILGALGIGGEELIAWTYGQGVARADIALVALHVAALAAAGNVEAIRLLRRAARELAALGRAAGRAAGLSAMRWSFAGGVLGNAALRGMVADALGVEPVVPLLPPVGGAVLAAARGAGWDVGAEFVGRLAGSLRDAAEKRENA